MFVEIRKELMNPHAQRLPFTLLTVGSTERQGVVIRTEGADFHQVLWVTEGEGLFTVGEQRMLLGKGDGFFCRCGVPHGYRTTGDCFKTKWVSFLGGDALLDYGKIGFWLRFRASTAQNAAVKTLDEMCVGNSTVVSRSAAGYTWLSEWVSEMTAPQITAAQEIRRFLEAHYAEPLSLNDIAEQVHMSRYALCHYYARTRGISVMEQLKRIRIAKAKQMLRFTSHPVAEIGRLCGYENASYFGKQFREETGQTPVAYRLSHNAK